MHTPTVICLLVSLVLAGAIAQDCQIFKRINDDQTAVQQRSIGQPIFRCVMGLIAFAFALFALKIFLAR